MVIDNMIKTHMLMALYASTRVVRTYQRTNCVGVETKSDSTIVTSADRASDEAGKIQLRKIPGVTIHGEESGVEGEGDILIYLDPLDGSMPYAAGAMTSTVIVAAVEKKSGKVLCCLVGDPSSERVWSAETGGVCEASFAAVPVRVCDGVLDRKSRVFIDSYPGFTKNGRMILSTSQLNALHARIQEKSGMLMLGSNGLHHALVANGGKGAVGAITTAIGGPWDVCPVLLVLAAGGFARAFEQTEKGLVEKNPLCVAAYDIVITGNSKETVDTLSGYVLSV